MGPLLKDPLAHQLRDCCLQIVRPNQRGTGFFIAPDLILTCAHVLDPKRQTAPGTEVETRLWQAGGTTPGPRTVVKAVWPHDDLVLLGVERGNFPFAPLGAGARLGQEVIGVGFPGDGRTDRAEYFLANYEGSSQRADEEGHIHEEEKLKSGQIERGFSGGPLLNSESGRVMGVVVATRDRNQDLGGWAVSSAVILRLLQEQGIALPGPDFKWREAEQQQLFETRNRNDPRHDPVAAARSLLAPMTLTAAHVFRPTLREKVKSALLDTSPAAARYVTIIGMPGMGKSSLAAEVVIDETVEQRFSDGIFWLTVGRTANMLELQSVSAAALGETTFACREIRSGARWLAQLLRSRSVLLVLDDLWESEQVEAFTGFSGQGRVLGTSRSREVFSGVRPVVIEMPFFDPEEATRLLAPNPRRADQPEEAKWLAKVVEQCAGLPFALAMAARLISDPSLTLQAVADLFARTGMGADPGWVGALTASIQTLTEEEQQFFRRLAIFPEDANFTVAAAAHLMSERDRSDETTDCLLRKLFNRSLILRANENPGISQYRLHDLVHEHLAPSQQSLPELHGRLIDGFGAACGWQWGALQDAYALKHLAKHMIQAHRLDDLRSLLFEPGWIARQFSQGSFVTLQEDLIFLQDTDGNAAALLRALESSRSILHHHPELLGQQLAARFRPDDESFRLSFSEKCRALMAPRNLFPLTPSLAGGERRKAEISLAAGRELGGEEEPSAPTSTSPLIKSLDKESIDYLTLDETRDVLVAASRMRITEVSTVNFAPLPDRTFAGSPPFLAVLFRELGILVGVADGRLQSWLLSKPGEVTSVPDSEMLYSRGLMAGAEEVSLAVFGGSGTKRGRFWKMLQELEIATRQYGAFTATSEVCVYDAKLGKVILKFRPHRGALDALDITPDGRRLVTASGQMGRDHCAKVWEIPSGKLIAKLTGCQEGFTGVCISPAGDRVVGLDRSILSSRGHEILLWEGTTGRLLQKLATGFDPRGRDQAPIVGSNGFATRHIARSPCGRFFAAISGPKTIARWQFDSGAKVAEYPCAGEGINELQFSEDGKILSAYSRQKGWINLWYVETCARVFESEYKRAHLTGLCLSKDGSAIYAASAKGDLCKWWRGENDPATPLNPHQSAITAVVVSTELKIAFSLDQDGALLTSDMETGLRTGEGPLLENGQSLQPLADGQRFIVTTRDGGVSCLAGPAFEQRRLIAPDRHPDPGRRCEVVEKENHLVCFRRGSIVALHDLESGKQWWEFQVPLRADTRVSPAGDYLTATLPTAPDCLLLRLDRAGPDPRVIPGPGAPLRKARVMADSHHVVLASQDHKLVAYDLKTFSVHGERTLETWPMFMNPWESNLVVQTGFRKFEVLEVPDFSSSLQIQSATGNFNETWIKTFDSVTASMKKLGLNSSPRLLDVTNATIVGSTLFISDLKRLEGWDLKSGAKMLSAHFPSGTSSGYAVTPDGSFVASIGEGLSVLLWRLTDGRYEPCGRFEADAAIRCLAIVGDAGYPRIVAGDSSGALHFLRSTREPG